ncbi:hypothetical protein OIU78_022678 [Salix suchowensis]|uniref:Uncharacterized protein n=2 Tax=Salix TaxID=40685 RepID=A0A9Q0W882_9ROSI|nr:hypothetical protein OIU78_022678 [Salix suchowensis]KAJ6762377.1 hypothetical protein OIU74_024976 [Salix koriyanagi]
MCLLQKKPAQLKLKVDNSFCLLCYLLVILDGHFVFKTLIQLYLFRY